MQEFIQGHKLYVIIFRGEWFQRLNGKNGTKLVLTMPSLWFAKFEIWISYGFEQTDSNDGRIYLQI